MRSYSIYAGFKAEEQERYCYTRAFRREQDAEEAAFEEALALYERFHSQFNCPSYTDLQREHGVENVDDIYIDSVENAMFFYAREA